MPGFIEKRQSLHRRIQQNEQKLEQLTRQLQSAQKMATLGTIACLAAHECNNLLTPIINYAELALQNEHDPELTHKALQKVVQHGESVTRIVRSMLAQAQTSSQQSPQRTLLRPLIDESLEMMTRDLSKDRIDVQIQIPQGVTVCAIPEQLRQVLLNLLINARQAMLPGGGTLTIAAENGPGNTTILNITDTGCGIAPEDLESVFTPFFSTKQQADQPDMRGTGLGLTVCLDILEFHNGTIKVQSRPQKGSTFTLTLPTSDNK